MPCAFLDAFITSKMGVNLRLDLKIVFVFNLSSIALASEDPVDEDSPRNLLLGYADYGFTAIFTLECCLKVKQ